MFYWLYVCLKSYTFVIFGGSTFSSLRFHFAKIVIIIVTTKSFEFFCKNVCSIRDSGEDHGSLIPFRSNRTRNENAITIYG